MLKKTLLVVIIILYHSSAFAIDLGQFKLDKPYKAPNIRFSNAQGNILNLTDYQGKVVLVNFWSTWCIPCVEEMPALEKLTKSMEGRDVVVLPLSIDFKGAPAVQKFYKEHGLTGLPVYLDRKGRGFNDYKLKALPTSLIIDRHGNVTAKILGAVEWDSAEVREYLLRVGR